MQAIQLNDTMLRDLMGRVLAVANPRRVLLFGSAARGDAHAESDLDILVVVDEGTPRRPTAQAIYRNLVGFPAPVDVIVATQSGLDQFGKSPGLIYQPALNEGLEIYAA